MIHNQVCGIALVWDKPKPSEGEVTTSTKGQVHLGFLARNRRVNINSVLLPKIECIKVDYVFCINI